MTSPPRSGGHKSGRPAIDAKQIAAALERQAKDDATQPPDQRLTLMDAIRMAEPLILSRREAKWTDAMLSRWLADLGVKISVETLRVYRSRLRLEHAPTPPKSSRAPPPPLPLSEAASARSVNDHSGSPASQPQADHQAKPASDQHESTLEAADADVGTPPTFNPNLEFDDDV